MEQNDDPGIEEWVLRFRVLGFIKIQGQSPEEERAACRTPQKSDNGRSHVRSPNALVMS